MRPNELEIHRTTETLKHQDLLDLFMGRKLAIRILNFCPEIVCATMSERIMGHHRLAYYPHAPAIGRVMNAFYEGHSDSATRESYYKDVPRLAHEFRELSWPYLNPLDHLRLILEDVWPTGAVRENIHGRPMAFGLAQLFKAGSCALPHQDFLRMDEPDNHYAQTLITQVTALVYVQPAISGGKLELWREHYDHDDFMKRKNEHAYGLDYKKIPPPSVVITPSIGEMVMADSTKVHAVTTVDHGLRIAVNCFIGFRGAHEPLTFWS